MPGWKHYGTTMLCSCAALAAWLIWQNPAMSEWLHWGGLSRALHLSYLIAGGVGIYIGVLWCMGVRLQDFYAEST